MEYIKAKDLLAESVALQYQQVDVKGIDDIPVGQEVKYKGGREEGLMALVVKHETDGTVSLKVGNATRIGVKPEELYKMVRTGG